MIITNDEIALRVKCEDVSSLEEAMEIINLLQKELDEANRLGKGGIGLAAPQIGISKKVAIVRLGKDSINLVNCNIKDAYDPAIFKNEGCLSFPGKTEDTTRFQEIHVTNNLVEPHSFVATGLLSVVCQHEMDHLDSVIFTDRMLVKSVPFVKKKKCGPNDPCDCGSGKKYKKCCGVNK